MTRRQTPRRVRNALAAVAAVALLALPSAPVAQATTNSAFPDLPVGFAKVKLAAGLKNPTVMVWAPNGDIYIGQQAGTIQIFRNGAILPTPLGTIPNVYASLECGLLGLALDPNYATNGYIYVSYVINITNSSGVTQPFSRLSRFTVVNGALSLATEKVFAQGNQSQNQHHPGNTVKVGPDGKLYWSVGDNVPSITNAQTLTNIYGKILRFNLDGTIPSDNPFLNVPGAVPSIWAWGLRNPFRFNFLPDGRPITEDTGSSFWEELDIIQRGGNYGWDFYEGNAFSSGYINPAYAYGHVPTDGAASAIVAYQGNVFPQTYANTVFVGDYQSQVIHAVSFDPTYTTETSDTIFDSSVGTIADLEEGPDGNLYYIGIYEGTFWKIYPTGPFAPTAAASSTPSAGLAPLNVQFSSAGSSDPYGLALTYSWDFGDGSPLSTSANPSHQYTSNGTYTATLTVNDGSQTGTVTTQVTVGNTAPTASIDSPGSGATYNAGQTISFSGSGMDATDGTLGASAFSWQVDFISNGAAQPFYLAEVPGPFYSASGVASGSFQIPTDPTQTPSSFYRITMTATDSLGLKTTVTRDIHPNTTSWTAGSSVPGALFYVDGTLQSGSYSTTDVVGVRHTLRGIPAQAIGGTRYRLRGWADGSGQEDIFASTASPATYTVNEDPVAIGSAPAGWATVDIGAPLMAGTTDYSAATSTFYMDGSGSDIYGAKDQFHYTYQTLTGDGTIIARVRYQTNSDPWAKTGLMFKASPTAGAAYVDALVTPDVSPNTPNTNGVNCTVDGCDAPLPPINPAVGNGNRIQYTTGTNTTGGINPTALPGYSYPNKWLKLQRIGNVFYAYQSKDGVTWQAEGHVTVSSIPATATVGIFDTSHNIGQYSSVAFDNVSVTGPVTPPPNDFSIAASPNAVSTAAGSSTSTSINTALVSGTAETVSMSASGLPSGVTASFNPTSVTAGSSSQLTLSAAANTTPGTYSITVTGTAASATHSTTVGLTVSAPPANDFSIAASPSTVSTTAGSGTSTSINTALVSGSAETVALSTSGLPSGVTASFNPTSVTAGGSSQLTLTAAANTTPGTYSITVTGAAPSATHSTSVSLAVSAPSNLPSPWADIDVGSPTPAGSASYANGVFTVNGSGADIWGTSDQFNYVYQNASGSGNGTLIARVASQSNTGSSNVKAGIIWKASTASGSPYMLIAVNNTGIVKVQYMFNGSIQASSTYTFPNVWMKLVRSSNTFTAYLSPDGVTWTSVLSKTFTTIPAASTLGLFECSHKTGVLGTATFDNVSFTPGP